MADSGATVTVPDEVHKALATICSEEGFRKPTYKVELGCEPGDGYTSVVYRVTIQDEVTSGRANAPLAVMCKTTTQDEGAAGSYKGHIFASEGFMYDRVLPALEEVAGLAAPLPWPRCLHVAVGGPASPLLVLADLRPEGFQMADRRRPLDFQHCRLALTQLARFHGAGLALGHRRRHDLKAFLAKLGDPSDNPQMKDMYTQFCVATKSAPDMIRDRFPEGSETHVKLQKIFAKFAEDFFLAVKMDGEVGTGIIHGDCHSNNFMFQYDKSGAVTGCRLIDFQCARAGCTASDVASLLLPATDKATRAAHWQDLLRHYHAELQATLRAAGCADPDAIYSWDQFMDRLRLASLLGLVLTPPFVQAWNADAQEAQEFKDSLNALHGEAPAPMAFQMKHTPVVKERFGDLVQDMVEWGWL